MSNNQEIQMLEMEQALHTYVLDPWSADHSGRPNSAITQLAYDRVKHPEQRLDTYRTGMDIIPAYFLPSRLLSVIIRSKLAASFKSQETAQRMIDSYKDRPASRSDDTPLLEKISEIIDTRVTISLVDTHAEFSGGFKLLAALSAALAKRKYHRLNQAIISNTMTREALGGKPVAKVASPIAHVVWVNPDTDSYERLIKNQDLDDKSANLIKQAAAYANAGAMRELKKARKRGGVLQWAPFSSAVIREYASNGDLSKLKTPPLPSQVPGLLSRSRYALPVGYWDDYSSGEIKWAIGNLIDRDAIDVEDRRIRDGIYTERTIGELCTILAELSRVPVENSGKIFEIAPHRIDASHISVYTHFSR
jgi:hypothetical protein